MKIKIIIGSCLALTLCNVHADHLSSGIGIHSAAPLWSGTPSTLPKGRFSVSFKTEFQKLRPFSDQKLIQLRTDDALANPDFYEHHHDDDHDEGEHEDASSHARQADLHSVDHLIGGAFSLAYGLTDDLTVGLRLPFVYRSNIREVSEGHFDEDGFEAHDIFAHGDSEGLGDMSVWGQYRFFNRQAQQAALLLGFKAPTGETDNTGFKRRYNVDTPEIDEIPANNTDHSDLLETHLQPGSGSWDGLFGLAYSYDFDVVQLSSSLLYSLTTEGSQQTDLGDTFNYNLALSLPTKSFAPCSRCSWAFVMELNGEWRDKEKRAGISIGNSGGHTLYVAPGIRLLSGQNWNIGASFGYAVITDLNGDQSEPDYRAMGTIGFAL